MNETTSNKKSVFWEALILAIFIFASGIFLGYLLEMNRTNDVITLYQQSELDMLDLKAQDSIMNLNNINCQLFFNEILDFADRTYNDAKLLERYEDANEISKGIMLQHKKYDLLRTSLWIDSIKLKEKCDINFTTVVYFYEYKSDDLEIKAEQTVFSKKLGELKEEFGSKVLLIPIAGNLEISSVDYILTEYNITRLPSILINENIKIDNLDSLSLIDSYF